MFKRLLPLMLCGLATVASAQGAAPTPAPPSPSSYVGRPIYSEPSTGLQLPPGCAMQPSWRTRLSPQDYEVWIVDCNQVARTWLLKRSVLEMVNATQARLRYQVLDEQLWPEESAGESLSVQCVGRARQDSGYVVAGAKWRSAPGKGGEVGLTGAKVVVRADLTALKFVPATLADVDCARYPEREAMMLRLQRQSQK